jgi:AcrR family transcriptional regulator
MVDTLDRTDTSLGRRERKKRATRLALKAAALDLVAERGYANVTVEDIADAVDVSVRTFFNYFPSKEAAVVGQDPESVAAMVADLISLPPETSPINALRTVLTARIRAIGEDIDLSGEDHIAWSRRFQLVRSQPEVLNAYTKNLTIFERALADALLTRLGGDESLRSYATLVTASSLAVMKAATTCAAREESTEALVEAVDAGFGLLAAGFDLDRLDVRTGEEMKKGRQQPAPAERTAAR